ncbi:mucin-13 [Grammomys surdaster]|uniref:mucin-13 n=1 Tax=Grammomys surdaster TaxID=491861 RepID=UPI00109F5D24|nr:mucin-13 [Grammomys surdaster]
MGPTLSTGSATTNTGSTNSTTGSTNSTTGSTNSTTGSTNSTTGSTNSTTGSTNSTTGSTNSTTGSTNSTTGSTNSTTGSTNATTGSPTPTVGSTNSTTGSTTPTGNSSQTSGTAQPASSSTVTSSSGTGSGDPCNPNPCKGAAACVKLHSESFCLCSEGNYYNTSLSSCMQGKTFPGEISMTANKTDDLENKNSVGYQDLHNNVVKFFQNVFNEPDYGQTVILKVSTASSLPARSVMRDAGKTKVFVSVVNIFEEHTTKTEETVSELINKTAENDPDIDGYVGRDLCEYYGCKKNPDNCLNGLQCTCKDGLNRLNPQVPFCFATECSETCSAEEKKQCLKTDSGTMECVCMPGYQKANGKCEECPFGYSGKDCKDQFQLILTIVGTVGGALILILLIAVIVSMSSKNKKKNVEEQKLIEDDFQNVRLRQTGFSNFGADSSIFPKVKTGVPSQTPNPYANQRSMPRPDY